MNKFKVGDVVKGNSNYYTITNKDIVGRVVSLVDDKHICIVIEKHSTKPREVGSTFSWLRSSEFDLIRKKPTVIINEA